MNLITFDKTTKRPVIRNSKPFVIVNKTGKFNFSQGARRLLKMKEGDRVVLHRDSVYVTDWYLEITTEDRGYKITMSKTDSRFTCLVAASQIFKSTDQKLSKLSFPISEGPYRLNDRILYTIETKKSF